MWLSQKGTWKRGKYIETTKWLMPRLHYKEQKLIFKLKLKFHACIFKQLSIHFKTIYCVILKGH